jgi:hypothetical protein
LRARFLRLGELKTQNDARSQATTLTYDLIGRATGRSEVDMTTTWTWDTATHGVGALTSVSAIGTAAGSTTAPFVRTMAYDSIGRPSQTTLAQGATTGTYTTAYNATNGQIDTLTYPSSFVAKYVYTALGYLSQVEDNATSAVLFTVNTRDAELHATQQTAGNGVVTNLSYAATTGQATAISAGSGAVAALGFSYDTLGNLTGRTDTNQGVYEKFCYDALNRLTNSATAASSPSLCSSTGGGITSKTVAYDQLGNITSKSDVGSYTYSGSGAGPHAVTSITGTVNGVVNPTYTYDANGNMTAGAGRTVGYTSFNMANSIAQGTLTATIVCDGDHMRFKMSHLFAYECLEARRWFEASLAVCVNSDTDTG